MVMIEVYVTLWNLIYRFMNKSIIYYSSIHSLALGLGTV